MSFNATIVEVAPAMVTKLRGGGVDPALLPERSSRVSGSANSVNVIDNLLKSTLLANDVMD